MRSRLFEGTFGAALLAALIIVSAASGSQLIDQNATAAKIGVDAQGRALLTYDAGGRVRHVLVVGKALNALPPTKGARQVSLTVDYGGGWGLYHKAVWQTFANICTPYDGPQLAWFVTGCKAPDGSYWALQDFSQALPDLGYDPWTAAQKAVWLELSHFKGPLPKLEVWQDWIYGGKYDEIFGRFSYLGQPVYGFGTTRVGAPTDSFGRLIYLDTFGAAAYGPGWRRENSFVPHNPSGIFCYGFYSYDPTKGGYVYPPGQTGMRGPGVGTRYRLTAQGPGLLPDVTWEGNALPAFDKNNPQDVALRRQMTAQLQTIAGGDQSCNAGHFPSI